MKAITVTVFVTALNLFSLDARADQSGVLFGAPYYDCQTTIGGVLSGVFACKRSSPIKSESKKYYFSNEDFNWKCNSIGSVEFDFYNSSTQTVRKVVIEGATKNTKLSENVFVPPGSSEYVYTRSSGAFCTKEKSALLYFEYEVPSGGECLQRYTAKEIDEAEKYCAAKANVEKQRETIFNNCVIEKSKDIDKRALTNVRSVCRDISINPSTLQRWRFGK